MVMSAISKKLLLILFLCFLDGSECQIMVETLRDKILWPKGAAHLFTSKSAPHMESAFH